MHGTNLRRRIRRSPHRFGHLITLLLLAFLEQILDRTWHLLHLLRRIKQVHLVVLIANLIWQATRPSLDLVELVLLLIVACLAHVDFLVGWEVARAAFVVTCEEHDEAAVDYFIDGMVAILAGLDDFILIEVTVEAMDSLLGAIVPASVDPFVAICVLPGTVKLSHNGLGEIVGVLDVHPVAYRTLASAEQP